MLKFDSPLNIRQIITFATLCERPVVLENVHMYEQPQGIKSYEIKFMRLIEKISNGAKFEIGQSGTTVKYYPGIITNNEGIHFDFECGKDRNITYYLEYLTILALFGKSNLSINLSGITNDNIDSSIDNFMNVCIPVLKKFGIEGEIKIKVNKRGFRPEGKGEVHVKLPFVKFLRSVNLVEKGLIKRVRGVCCGGKVSPQVMNDIISKVREILNDYLPDVWVYSDFCNKNKMGPSRGYGVSLFAETNTGSYICSEDNYDEHRSKEENFNIGEKAAMQLLDEILYSGSVDSFAQTFALNLMVLAEKKVSFIKLGRVTSFTIENIRIIRQFLGVTFKIQRAENEKAVKRQEQLNEEEEEENNNVDSENNKEDNNNQIDNEDSEEDEDIPDPQLTIFSCYGVGLQNLARQTF